MSHQPYKILGAERGGRWVVSCDHATNTVPPGIGPLGLPEADMQRHIAYDIGAAGLTRHLAAALEAPAVLSDFSRLVIDPNRGEDDPTLLMRLYDGTIIPGNRHADAAEVSRRLDLLHRPYHAALGGVMADRDDPVLVAVHSFTPRLNGRAPRPWQVGILSAWDRRLSDPVIDALRAQPDLCVGDNEPYVGHLPGDAVHRHALKPGHHNILIEVRQDLIADSDGQRAWADRLAPVLQAALPVADAART
ncbi:N-formylglutamate amidohydrolase [Pseudaestuariivita atlantica]|uniref:N-formylglutamate amidohydrolase n=1 Tax=Pseudaestuariivita atlantica TaxID=1317121 RepID=A0A0L1JR85_9RHOB|nr:N-formylglutamate amidohydrolase [Pseudaestuariivita atlantica]KNG94304.1 N-formylglutamate amidohydrolase [Pseudaestuariivita atlantica]